MRRHRRPSLRLPRRHRSCCGARHREPGTRNASRARSPMFPVAGSSRRLSAVQTRTDEKYVGRYYGERRIEITPELVAHYARAVHDQNPWYFGDSPFGGPVAPSLILHSEVYHTIDWYLSYFGNLHARQEFEFFAPIMVGDTVTARRQIVERYLKRDREYVVMETGCYDDDGRLLNRGRT